MRRPQSLRDVPAPEEIFGALKSLSTRPRGHIILSSKVLLGLRRAQDHMPSGEENPADDFLEAVRMYLNEAVTRIEQNQNRVIAEVVLGLGDKKWQDKKWREESAPVRRTMAGQLFRGDEDKVGGSTMRQLYQDPALQEFADVIWRDEKKARGGPIANP